MTSGVTAKKSDFSFLFLYWFYRNSIQAYRNMASIELGGKDPTLDTGG